MANDIARATMRIGYGRVSTIDQDVEVQFRALRSAGCTRLYGETASGMRADRPQLTAALDYLRPGDTLVVVRLDRLGRSLSHLVQVLDQLRERGVLFESLEDHIDTSTAQGQLMLHLLASFAEFERALIRERTMAGLAAARANGRHGGRPRVLTAQQRELVRTGYHAHRAPVSDLARAFQCSRATIYRTVADS